MEADQERRGLLLIDDNPADAHLMQEALQGGKQFTVTLVANLKSALRFLRREAPYENAQRPALIVLDWLFPGGEEAFLTTVKADPQWKRIPVMVITGLHDPQAIARMYDSGASCCIQKPLELAEFLRLLEAIELVWGTLVVLPSLRREGEAQQMSLWC